MENSFNILEKNGIIWMNIYDECDNIIKNTMDNFNLKKFLVENKMTRNSRLLSENEDKIKTILSKIGDIEEKIYEKLHGSRQDVWDGIAYKTSGGLVKLDLMKNSIGKIVSKKKSILETFNKRLEKCGVNKQKENLM
jgi:hypothetical protein